MQHPLWQKNAKFGDPPAENGKFSGSGAPFVDVGVKSGSHGCCGVIAPLRSIKDCKQAHYYRAILTVCSGQLRRHHIRRRAS